MNDLFEATYLCNICGLEAKFFLDEVQAAFDENRRIGPKTKCEKCGSINWKYKSCFLPEPSSTQIKLWAQNEKLHFDQQDENFWLSNKKNVSLIVQYLDNKDTLESKKEILFNALCILLYNNIHPEKKDRDPIIAEEIKKVLNQRIFLFSKYENFRWQINDYVAEIIYPELGLSYKPSYVNWLLLNKNLSNKQIAFAISSVMPIETKLVNIYDSEDAFLNTNSSGEVHIIKSNKTGTFPLFLDIWSRFDVTNEQLANVFIGMYQIEIIIDNDEAVGPENQWLILSYPLEKKIVTDKKILSVLKNI